MKKKTVGEVSLELLRNAELDHSAHEQMEENLTEYESYITKTVDDGIKTYPGDFFVVVLTLMPRIGFNTPHCKFFHRWTAPTPGWDQTVYHYRRSSDDLELLWTIPDKKTCTIYLQQLQTLSVAPDEKELAQYVLDFYSGDLLERAKKLNGETSKPTPSLIIESGSA